MLDHIINSGDPVLYGVSILLLLMSIVTWSVIVIRAVKLYKAKKGNATAKNALWHSVSFDEALQKTASIESPMSDLAKEASKAFVHYHQSNHTTLANSVPLNEYLVTQIRSSMSQIMRRFDGGMTALASIGATAPFVGLFGTVWGIYHALINIGQSGQMSIAAVAGPIGEALVATAAGLAVAIPAVLAYNFLIRGNKTLAQDMDAFAHDLHVQLLNKKD